MGYILKLKLCTKSSDIDKSSSRAFCRRWVLQALSPVLVCGAFAGGDVSALHGAPEPPACYRIFINFSNFTCI